jgi:hypothetical protein
MKNGCIVFARGDSFFVNVAMFVFTAGIKGIQSLLKSK